MLFEICIFFYYYFRLQSLKLQRGVTESRITKKLNESGLYMQLVFSSLLKPYDSFG